MKICDKPCITLLDYECGNLQHKEAFARLNTEWIQTFFELEEQDHQMFADPTIVLAADGCIKLAKLENEIVGVGGLIQRKEGIYEIIRMGVSSRHQGVGIDRQLLEALINEAKVRNLQKVYLTTSTKLLPAIALYTKCGFLQSNINLHAAYKRANLTFEKPL